MKKMISVVMILTVILSLFSGCGSTGGGIRIAIVQQLDHASLTEIAESLEARLEELAAESGKELTVKVLNGQNDPSILNQIGAQVVGDGYDMIIPIASLAAQCMAAAADGTDIPVVYAAISNPEEAGLTGLPNVTGTSDALDTGRIFDMMFTLDPDVRTVGLLYSNSEPNSVLPIRQAKEILSAKGIQILEKTGTTADEVIAAAGSLVGRVDAVFTPTDNAIMNVAGAVAEILNEAGIPHYTGADSFVAAGSFVTCGVNYQNLGKATAELAFEVLETGNVPEFRTVRVDTVTVNTETAAKLGIDYTPLTRMADTVREVTTGA